MKEGMDVAEELMIGIELLGVLVLFAAIVLMVRGGGPQRLLIVPLCGSLVQNTGYLLELTASSLEGAVAAVRLEYLGSMFVPLVYCIFIWRYCFQERSKWMRLLFLLLAAVDLAMLPVVFTAERHTLFYESVAWLESGYDYHYLSLSYGPLYYVCMLFQTLIPYALSIFFLLHAIFRRGEEKGQYGAFLLISSLPVVALLAYALKLTFVFDPAPIMLALSLSLLSMLVWNARTEKEDLAHL